MADAAAVAVGSVVPLASFETTAEAANRYLLQTTDTTADYRIYHARAAADRPKHFEALAWHADHGTLRKSGLPLVSDDRLARFAHCGKIIYVMRHRWDDKYRLKGNFCRDRWCGACQYRRRRQILHTLQQALHVCIDRHPDYPPRKLLLTLRSTDEDLASMVTRIQRAFRALTKTDLWISAVKGYIWAIEVKRQDHSGYWYVHIHGIILTPWLSSTRLSRAWLGITGDSHIATCSSIDGRTEQPSDDAEPLTADRVRRCCDYVAKYITKPANLAKMALPYACAALASLASKRLWTCGGLLREARKAVTAAEQDKFAADDWTPVDTLHVVAARARSGQEDARRILEYLGLMPRQVKHGQPPMARIPQDLCTLAPRGLGPAG